MKRSLIPICLLFAAFLLAGAGVRTLRAQEAPPADGAADPAAAAEPAAPKKPAAAKPKSKKPADVDPAEEALHKVDPLVADILSNNPQTADELMRNIMLLVRVGAADKAAPYLAKLEAMRMAPPDLAAFGRRVGSDVLIQLAGVEPLQPAAARFANGTLEIMSRAARDPARLDKLVRELGSGDAAVRQSAMVDLREAGDFGIVYLLAALADPKFAPLGDRIVDALVEFGQTSVPPLLGALEAPDGPYRAHVITALGLLSAERSIVYLTTPAVVSTDEQVRTAANDALKLLVGAEPTREEAVKTVQSKLDNYLRGVRPFTPDYDGLVAIWHYDAAKKFVAPVRYDADDAAIVLAARLARDLMLLMPDDATIRDQYLVTTLEAAEVRAGLPGQSEQTATAIRAEVAKLEPAAIGALLHNSLENGRLDAAIAAAELLGEKGSYESLQGAGNRVAPLVEAVSFADRRVKFAALKAILKIDPQQPFAGSSYVLDALDYFAATGGPRRAVVGYPRAADAQSLVALLGEIGFDASAAYTGRDLVRIANESAHIELVYVYANIDKVPLREVLYQLRNNPRTGRLPIAIIAPLDELEASRELAATLSLCAAFPRPHDAASMKLQVDVLRRMAGRRLLTDEERTAQATQSLQWLAKLAKDKQSFFEAVRAGKSVKQSLHVAGLSQHAAATLAEFPTADSQQALIDLASEAVFPLADRRAAALALGKSVKQHGILLTTSVILRQYDRYNASRAADAGTQAVLGQLLDILETPSAVKKEVDKPAAPKPADPKRSAPKAVAPQPAPAPKK